LHLLSQQFPTIQAASTAIISLTAQPSLPKGTEHFVSDVHGEYEALCHLLKHGSGSIRRRIDELFGDSLAASDRQHLATLIYYPRQKLPLMLQIVDDKHEWYRVTLLRLIQVARAESSKYPHPDTGHIITGRVPVRVGRGESPVRAGGRLIVIDGAFAKAYQRQTGIAG